MGYTKWERHNAENGEHIWCGDKHIADIVTDVDNPAWDRNTSEISKFAILMHNDPKYKSAPDLYETLEYIIRELDKANIIKADSIFMEMPNKALAKAKGVK